MLKKQTVWLLTMLSLMIVLSVYYMMIDKDDQQAYMEKDPTEQSATTDIDNNNENDEGEQNNQGLTNDGNRENNNGENTNDPDPIDSENAIDEADTNEQANLENDDENTDNEQSENGPMADSDITNVGKEELFTMNRMELQNERSKKVGYLEDVVASANATTEEKNAALDDIYKIDEIKTKESILQNTILTQTDTYEDVLVRSENDMVYVHVMTEDLSKEEAIDIMQLVRDEFGEVTVDVKYN